MRELLGSRESYLALVAIIAIGTVAGLAILWPQGDAPKLEFVEGVPLDETYSAEVKRVEDYQCPGYATGECSRTTVKLQGGPDEGNEFTVDSGFGAASPDYEAGDSVRVIRAAPGPDAVAAASPYAIVDFERKPPLLALALIFAVLVIVFGRARGALALLGLLISLGIVLLFVVPAILRDSSPLAVALVGSMAVMLTTIPLAHGVGPKSLAAICGTAASLVVVVVLALIFTDLAHLTGIAAEGAATLSANDQSLSLEGLLIAGIVIGSLGVLDDVTISQSSTVMALRGANPSLGARDLFDRAIEVGRDHVSATVNTLVLAYVGTSLTTLLVFGSGQLGFFAAVNLEVIASVIVATLVGSIGLICAVPITTGLAALLASSIPAEELQDDHGHVH